MVLSHAPNVYDAGGGAFRLEISVDGAVVFESCPATGPVPSFRYSQVPFPGVPAIAALSRALAAHSTTNALSPRQPAQCRRSGTDEDRRLCATFPPQYTTLQYLASPEG